MIIILEGNEAVYKSTVANKVSKKLDLPIIKGSSFELATGTNEQLFQHFVKLSEMDNIITDRNIYSNITYATLYKDYAMLTNEQLRYIENKLKDKAIVYYLYADDEIIKERIRKRGDEYVDVSMVSKINKLFTEVISKSSLKVIFYDTAEWTSSQIANEIINDYKYFQENR